MTSKESFAAYEAVCNEKYPGIASIKAAWKTASEAEKDAMVKEKMKWDEEHDKRVREAIRNLIPEIGVKCTVVYYSDKRASTVSRIISPCKIAVRHNETVCNDWYASDYDILPELEGGEMIFTKRRNGLWCMEGHSTRDGVLLMLHYHRHYIDPSF